jgi:hypothetical protein
MYMTDYRNTELLIKERLREAEAYRAALDYARSSGDYGLLQRIRDIVTVQKQPVKTTTTEMRHVSAL